MKKTKEFLKALCEIPAVSGREREHTEALKSLCGEHFDSVECDRVGNIIFKKLSGKKNAKKLMLDAHFDIIGMMVTKILDKGFLAVTQIGGIDTRTLPSAEVTIYGKREVYGVIASIPPHLSKNDENPKWDDIIIDTGLEESELKELVGVGDYIKINAPFTELANDFVLCGGLDNRACLCACLLGAINAQSPEFDVYVLASAQEETGPFLARTAAAAIMPDYIITTDVNFAREPNIEKRYSIECSKGPSVDLSALTCRVLSKKIIALAKEHGIPCQVVVEPTRTGTNNDMLAISGKGAKNALMSIPLKAMHTSCESVNVADIKALSEILSLLISTKEDELC